MPKKIDLNRIPNFEKRVIESLKEYYPNFDRVDWEYSYESADFETGYPQLIVLAWIGGRSGAVHPIHVSFTAFQGFGAKPRQTKRIQLARDYFYSRDEHGEYIRTDARETVTITHRIFNGQSVFNKRFDDYPSEDALYGERVTLDEYLESRAIAVKQGVASEKPPIPTRHSYIVERIKYEN